MESFLVIILAAAAASALTEEEKNREAMFNPDLSEGDLLTSRRRSRFRSVTPDRSKRWPNAEIPYVIDISLKDDEYLIKQAIAEFHKYTCVKFIKRKPHHRNYVNIFNGNGCHSALGALNNGEQELSIGESCRAKGVILHELGHTVGLHHEHNRSDRDEYVNIYLHNLKDGMKHIYEKWNPGEDILYTPFDYDSVMIYGNYAGSKEYGKLMTIEAKNGHPILECDVKYFLTNSDIYRVNKMYKCTV